MKPVCPVCQVGYSKFIRITTIIWIAIRNMLFSDFLIDLLFCELDTLKDGIFHFHCL